MKKIVVLSLALIILLFITSCTVGKAYETTAAGDGTGISAGYVGACGDHAVNEGENCLNCPTDIICAENQVCDNGICSVLPLPGTPYKVLDADGKLVGVSVVGSNSVGVFNKNVVNGTTLYAFLSYDFYSGKFTYNGVGSFLEFSPVYYESEDCSIPPPMPPLHSQRKYRSFYIYEGINYDKIANILDDFRLTCEKIGKKFKLDPVCYRKVKTNLDPNSEEGQKPIRSMRPTYNSTECIPVDDKAYNYALYESVPLPQFKGPFKIVLG